MRCRWFLPVLVLLLTVPPSPADEKAAPTSVLLFDSGRAGYPRYRIPCLLVSAKGTVLAFCEGRKDGRGLTGDIDIVLKRSTDSGKTWQALQVVADDGLNTLGNPCAVVDRQDGTIWLALTRSHGRDTEEDIVSGKSRETTRVLITFSRDDGRTWAPPRDITATVKKDTWTWYGTGPGIGVQTKGGRMVFPCYHAEAGSRTYRSHAIFSDDHGKTWRAGATVGEHCTECQIAERADGNLVLNARTIKGAERRTTAVSRDGGATWTAATHDQNLYDPNCQAALYRLTEARMGDKSRWLFSHPAGPGRRDLTVRLSYDEGKKWPVARVLRSGDGQYSCLALLPDGAIGCLHDSWVDKNYRLFFVRFTLEWLTEGRDRLAP